MIIGYFGRNFKKLLINILENIKNNEKQEKYRHFPFGKKNKFPKWLEDWKKN